MENLLNEENLSIQNENENNNNLMNEICDQYKYLKKKLRKYKPKKRICILAIPRLPRNKYQPKVVCRYGRQIEIIREQRPSTRLEQLAFVQVRKLLAARDAYISLLSPHRYERYNRFIRKSMLSMYSRLANATPPQFKEKVRNWTKEDWERHEEWLASRAKPKKIIHPPTIERPKKPIWEFSLTELLAKPKHRLEQSPKKWIIKDSTKKYMATAKILELSKPKQLRSAAALLSRRKSSKISKGALRYKVTERVENLSVPRRRRSAVSDAKENPFQVIQNALKARATARVKDLAKPKVRLVLGDVDRTKISPNALKAKPTPRIIELATPKSRK